MPNRDYVIGQYYSKQKWVNPIRMLRTSEVQIHTATSSTEKSCTISATIHTNWSTWPLIQATGRGRRNWAPSSTAGSKTTTIRSIPFTQQTGKAMCCQADPPLLRSCLIALPRRRVAAIDRQDCRSLQRVVGPRSGWAALCKSRDESRLGKLRACATVSWRVLA